MRQILTSILTILIIFCPLSTAQGISIPPPPDPTHSDIENQVIQAIQRKIDLQQDRPLVYLVYETRIGSIRISDDDSWSIAQLNPIDPSTSRIIPAEPGLAIGKREDGRWQITLPGENGWEALIQSAPQSLLPEEDKNAWLNMYQQAAYPVDATVFLGYKLPWEAGKKVVLTQSISHYNPPDPTRSMHYAFDFATWHDASGESPMFAVHAAKAGRVKWARWTQVNGDAASPGNYLVIEDTTTTPYTYALYLHLAQNSIPEAFRQAGATVIQGQYIGMADDTGNSTGNHLHFQVHTIASSYWGNAVDITFSDVPINGGRPRTPSEASNWPQYGSQGQWEYTSGNVEAGDQSEPNGGFYTPQNNIVFDQSLINISGWAHDNDQIESVQIKALYRDHWHVIGPEFTSSPFEYTWDVCASQVPDGPLSIALEVTDISGNSSSGLTGLRHLAKEFDCPVQPPACIPGSTQVALFADPDYQGECVLLDVGTHNQAALGGVGDNNSESILVGSQVWATLFDGDQQGRGKTYRYNDSSLADNRTGADRVSSLVVQPVSTLPSVPVLIYPSYNSTFTSNASLSLSWDDPGGATEFQLNFNTDLFPWQPSPYYHLDSLPAGVHFWQVRSRNSYGTSNWSNLSFFTIASAVSNSDQATVQIPYSEAMEDGYNGWLRGEWDLTSEYNHTPGGSLSFNYEINDQITNYNTGNANSGYLTSPPIDISSPGYALQFWYRYETEGSGQHWDQRWVQIAVDGNPFTNALQLFSDPPNTWLQSPPIDLSEYSGHTIQIRFLFETLDALQNAFKGWHIDDVTIQPYAPPACDGIGEPDSSSSQARLLTINSALEGQICPQGDQDYYAVPLSAGDQVGILVEALDPYTLDTYVSLLDADFLSPLDENDDQQTGIRTDSYLSYRITRDGIYYIRVRAWNHPGSGGVEYGYRLTLFGEDRTPPSGSTNLPANGSALPFGIIPILIDGNDPSVPGEFATGVSHIEFFWHSGDWDNSSWTLLGSDWDGTDGWGYNFDTTPMPEQIGAALYVRIFDWAGNSRGYLRWDLRLDLTPYDAYLPILSR